MASASSNELAIGISAFDDYAAEDRHRVIPTADSWYFRLKSASDRLLAFLLLIPALPLIGCIVLLVRATSPGPGIFRQLRVGKGGRVFTMYKIRSMRLDAEEKRGPTWAGVVRDPRVTPVGYWLRHLHLDELPQLFNVLCGHMSLIGPRPERPEFVSLLAEQIPGYLDRLAIAPGITGLAQINLPPDTDLDSVRRKLILDSDYIRNAGLLLDFRILLCTALRMLGIRHGRAVRLLALQRPEVLSHCLECSCKGPTTLDKVFSPATKPCDDAGPVEDNVPPRSRSITETIKLSDTIEMELLKASDVEPDPPKSHHRRVRAK